MHTFFASDIENNYYELTGSEAMHAVKVLRMKKGDSLYLLDGKGKRYTGEIRQLNSKSCNIEIIDSYEELPPKNITEIAIAPPKTAARLEFMLEKLTELNVSRITLFVSEYSERRKLNAPRLYKILIAALKQSGNLYLPKFRTMPSFNEIVSENFNGTRLIAHCYDTPKIAIQKAINLNENIQIFIGPEGDFSKTEIEKAVMNNFREISLTKQRLRTETAAVFAAVLLNNNYINTL